MVEGARLESGYRLNPYREFESHPLRQSCMGQKRARHLKYFHFRIFLVLGGQHSRRPRQHTIDFHRRHRTQIVELVERVVMVAGEQPVAGIVPYKVIEEIDKIAHPLRKSPGNCQIA